MRGVRFVTNRLKKHTDADEDEKPIMGGGTTQEDTNAEVISTNFPPILSTIF